MEHPHHSTTADGFKTPTTVSQRRVRVMQTGTADEHADWSATPPSPRTRLSFADEGDSFTASVTRNSSKLEPLHARVSIQVAEATPQRIDDVDEEESMWLTQHHVSLPPLRQNAHLPLQEEPSVEWTLTSSNPQRTAALHPGVPTGESGAEGREDWINTTQPSQSKVSDAPPTVIDPFSSQRSESLSQTQEAGVSSSQLSQPGADALSPMSNFGNKPMRVAGNPYSIDHSSKLHIDFVDRYLGNSKSFASEEDDEDGGGFDAHHLRRLSLFSGEGESPVNESTVTVAVAPTRGRNRSCSPPNTQENVEIFESQEEVGHIIDDGLQDSSIALGDDGGADMFLKRAAPQPRSSTSANLPGSARSGRHEEDDLLARLAAVASGSANSGAQQQHHPLHATSGHLEAGRQRTPSAVQSATPATARPQRKRKSTPGRTASSSPPSSRGRLSGEAESTYATQSPINSFSTPHYRPRLSTGPMHGSASMPRTQAKLVELAPGYDLSDSQTPLFSGMSPDDHDGDHVARLLARNSVSIISNDANEILAPRHSARSSGRRTAVRSISGLTGDALEGSILGNSTVHDEDESNAALSSHANQPGLAKEFLDWSSKARAYFEKIDNLALNVTH